ncbi:MAG: hypothetical protein ACE149_08355 [Armatimonadota bacterium]
MRALLLALVVVLVAATAVAAEESAVMADEGKATAPPSRAVLEGVPEIGFHIHLSPLPGSIYSVMQYIGDPCSYDYIAAVSGVAFRRFWNRDDGGNIDSMYLAPESYRRIFTALGYDYRAVPHSGKAAMVAAIKESIAKGRPVLAFGIIGPPECGIVTGYDKDGEVLYGYSYFQDRSRFPGYYEQPEWFERASWGPEEGAIIIGDKKPRPAERDTLISTLEWAVDLARTPVRPNRPNHASGLAAYDAWANGLEVDADYPADDDKTMGTRAMIHGDQAVMLEDRRAAITYLRSMASVAPEAAGELNAAADLYERAVGEMSGIWLWGHDMGPEVAKGLLDPATRRGIARHVRLARDREAEAVNHLEAALAALRSHPQ